MCACVSSHFQCALYIPHLRCIRPFHLLDVVHDTFPIVSSLCSCLERCWSATPGAKKLGRTLKTAVCKVAFERKKKKKEKERKKKTLHMT
ncbi:unnamed protein product [Chondrus crispus]|uniref:Uncharacterized protein n=1 Tax=Chondrus crispus TaxID=2769 RepID=R7Q378_CHOCR|nr:unnamed protein product [Chondrus crispus]CDF32982.1 unnamed protein product [Chondrus crispus]|eukprot:XP_005712785.1 unnamed protein product [Chondrus crispus]